LYNAGSFFDLAAIPHADYAAIVERCRSFERVIVECHPALVGERVLAFRDLLPASAGLEVALGLETAHPDVLEKLNKRMTLAGFRRAVRYLKEHGCRVRSFVLVRPPFLDEKASLEWARKSLDFAFDAGVDTVSLIPTRFGNGALEELNRQGLFDPPQIETLATAFEYGLSLNRGRVFADLWDLERIVSGSALSEWRARLGRWNLSQRAES
jgi:radical SAM enzyme (TIGR01210 family)